MKQNLILYFLFLYPFSAQLYCQKITLKIIPKDSIKGAGFHKIIQLSKNPSQKYIYKKLDSISEKLRKKGYFYNSIDSLVRSKNTYIAYFSLGDKIEKATINIPHGFELKNLNYKIDERQITLPIERLTDFLNDIVSEFDLEGKSFSQAKLTDIQIKKNHLFAKLNIYQSKKRRIDRVIINGYERFSKSYIEHYLGLKKGMTFNKKNLNKISDNLELLTFAGQIKPPEVLFSKDSTLLYLYLKKTRASSFNGLIGFSSKKNKSGIEFNGNLNLNLVNILNTGEQFKLLWRANPDKRQQFELSSKIPYIFNLPISCNLAFNIYKQDSTFLNTKFHAGIGYNFNPKTSIAVNYDTENSENLLEKKIAEVESFENHFWGLQFSYRTAINAPFLDEKFYTTLKFSFGNKKSEQIKTPQFKARFTAHFIWRLTGRNYIYTKNETGYLNSSNFTTNELFRIGGINSIRGFDQQSIFTPKYSYFAVEYRYITSENSYFYSITDFGITKVINSQNKNMLGIGLGYLFKMKNTRVNLAYVLGKISDTNFDVNDSKLQISLVSFF